MLVLLPLLAWLQYHWLGQVSTGERERMQANLRAAAMHLSQDFDRELTRAYMIFQLPAHTGDAAEQDNYARHYDLWMTTATHPKLIRDLFLAQPEKDHQLRLTHFNVATRRFESSEWPTAFANLRQRLEQHQQLMSGDLSRNVQSIFERLGQTTGTSKSSVRSSTYFRSTLGPLAEDIPALVISMLPSTVTPPALRPTNNDQRAATSDQMLMVRLAEGFAIVTLDLNYIQQEFIPALIKQYFTHDDELNYNLALISRSEPRKVIYQLGTPLPSEAWSTGDATATLGSVRLDEFSDLLSGTARTNRQMVFSHPERYTVRVMSGMQMSTTVPKLPLGENARPWELVIKHRSGSLETAVAGLRRRNLLVSFSVLLLLALSVGLLVISTRRAQRLARQQMEFVSAVSHELRTPLAVIRSAGENLADGVIDERGQVRRYGKLIAGEGRRLTEMVEQVLEFAGAQSGRKTYELRPTEINGVIESVLAASQPQITEGGFHIELDLPPQLPLVKADAAALRHAIQNLLSNAMKYNGASQWIGLRARVVANEQGTELRITIEDHGLGIAADDLPHIFEPFYRSKEVVAAQIHGNGLGLSLVKRIIEAHGGHVSVESEPGRGSAFTMHLPSLPRTNEISVEAGSAISAQY